MKLHGKSLYPVITREFTDAAELAEVVEVSEKTVLRILHGSRPFTRKEKIRISEYLGLPLSSVFAGEVDESVDEPAPTKPVDTSGVIASGVQVVVPLGSAVTIGGVKYKLDFIPDNG